MYDYLGDSIEMKYKLKKISLVTTSLLLFTACTGNNTGGGASPALSGSAKSDSLSKNSKHDFKDNDYEVPVRLGYGFDDRTGMSEGLSCLVNADDPSAIVLSNPQGSIDFTDAVSAQEIGSLLNTSISGSADFGLFSVSLAAKYTRDSMDTRQSINFNYVQSMAADATFTVKGVGNNILSSSAQSLLAEGNDAFTNVCGNSIVQSAKEGAVLIVNVSIQFANAASKEQFEGEASGSIAGIGSIKGAFEHSEQSSTKNATFAIKAYQLGGDPTKLAKIFGSPGPQGYNVVTCSATNLDSCQAIINDVIAYAQNDFQTSVNFKDPSTLFTYDFSTREYSRFGVEASLTPLTPAEQAAKNYLTTTITQDRQMLNYLNTYQQQSFYLSSSYVDDPTKRNIVQATKDYTTMIYNYNNFNIINACYGDTNKINTECISSANQVKSMRSMYQSSINFASNMALIMEMNSPIGTFIFIPNNGGVNRVGDVADNVMGGFVAYSPITKTYSAACVVDTTADNQYFKTYFPQFGGKSLYCFDYPILMTPGVNNFFVNGFGDRRIFGVGGHIVNGVETLYSVSPTGYNTQYFYSDSTDFKYSPI
ncbi:MAG: hypothetical protein K0R14_1392 [Burkholderiales bacterium]|jgi:hypothetical protein|nr:hypothetical protein [Burkholderiales bacterium]